jgi:hypothetical protein
MPDFPDIFADGMQIAAGPFSISVSLLLSDPTGETGTQVTVPSHIVARIRLSRDLARVMSDALRNAVGAETSFQIVEGPAQDVPSSPESPTP